MGKSVAPGVRVSCDSSKAVLFGRAGRGGFGRLGSGRFGRSHGGSLSGGLGRRGGRLGGADRRGSGSGSGGRSGHASADPTTLVRATSSGATLAASSAVATASAVSASVAVAIGYSLMLIGCMLLAREPITPRSALGWSLAGFAAVGLAPALGLAPELPGSAAAGLLPRQIWWVATAVATAGGLYLLARKPQLSAKAAGAALLVAPHLFGAPRPDAFESTTPAELAASFAATSIVVHALLWCLVGLGVGWFWVRMTPDAPREIVA